MRGSLAGVRRDSAATVDQEESFKALDGNKIVWSRKRVRHQAKTLTIDLSAAGQLRNGRFTPMNERRVTLAVVAAKAGVHVTTVSMALRNDTRLPESTRTRLQKLAASCHVTFSTGQLGPQVK